MDILDEGHVPHRKTSDEFHVCSEGGHAGWCDRGWDEGNDLSYFSYLDNKCFLYFVYNNTLVFQNWTMNYFSIIAFICICCLELPSKSRLSASCIPGDLYLTGLYC